MAATIGPFRTVRRGALSALAAALLAGAAVAAPAPASATTPPPPNGPAAHGAAHDAAHRLTGRPGYLQGVAVVGRGTVWAVGFHNPLRAPLLARRHPSWTVTPAAGGSADVTAVSAASATDVWSVGGFAHGPLALHWDGTGWTRVDAPTPGTQPEFLGVATLGTHDAWAVGGYLNDTTEVERTLVAHWDGTGWTRVASPSHGYSELSGVSFATRDSGWAVGGSLIEHWNGSDWSTVPHPARVHALTAVDALSRHNVWAVGRGIYHWNGTRWTTVAHPARTGRFAGVSATSRSDVWAVGDVCPKHGTCTSLTEHWDGARWTRVASPNPRAQTTLAAVDARARDDVWAVGAALDSPAGHLVVLHWTGSRWHTA